MSSAPTQLEERTLPTPLDPATSIDEMPVMTGTLNGVSFNYTYIGFGVNRSMDDANQWDRREVPRPMRRKPRRPIIHPRKDKR